jgi:integrase|tara:strand:- start:2705 stop:3379 length:675 start_codon:yes stop_codon:yes gene_type:complete
MTLENQKKPLNRSSTPIDENDIFWNSNGVISLEKLTKVINSGDTQHRSNSVPCSPGHKEQQSTNGYNIEAVLNSMAGWLAKARAHSPALLAVYELQMLYGLRISEVLRLQGCDVKSTRHIDVRASKGKEHRLVIPLESWEFYSRFIGISTQIFKNYNRQYFWREYRKLGIGIQVPGNVRRSVTHSLRHILISSLDNEKVNVKTLKSFIAHKSASAQEAYKRIKK